jgi:hypothetical protein
MNNLHGKKLKIDFIKLKKQKKRLFNDNKTLFNDKTEINQLYFIKKRHKCQLYQNLLVINIKIIIKSLKVN